MTYILGSKCKDGVVLVADRKITYPDGHIEYKDKLSMYYYPIVLGGSGSTPMLNNFADDALRETQKITDVPSISGTVFFNPPSKATYSYFVNYDEYIKKLEERVMALDSRYRNALGDMRFDALIATQTRDRGALLHYVYAERLSERIETFRVLGSAEPYGTIFTRLFWNKEKTMEQIAELGYFIIKYIEKFELNIKVGGEPQVWFIPDAGELHELSVDDSNRFREITNKRLVKHAGDLFALSF